MQIQYFVNSTHLENLKTTLQATNYREVFVSGHLLVLEADHGGNSLFLQDISLLEWFDSFEQFLSQHKKQTKAETKLGDIEQSYCLNVAKHGNLLTLSGSFSGREHSVQIDYAKFLHRLRFVARSLHVDLITFCPEILQHNEFANACQDLGIDLSKLKNDQQ